MPSDDARVEYQNHLETWGPHCGASLVVYTGHLNRLVRAVRKAERERLREALRGVGEFAAAHHAEQEPHLWLHALTVDIPDQVRVALDEDET